MSTPDLQRRKRFSLRGLLAAIAALSALFALLSPWLVHVRESQRRSLCKSNQRNIALAVNIYHQQRRRYPPSAFPSTASPTPGETNTITQFVPGTATSPTAAPYSFLVYLLPFLEQPHIYEQIDFNRNAFSPVNRLLAAESIPVFRCPSFRGPAVTADRQNSYAARTKPTLSQYKALSATTLAVLDNVDEVLSANGDGGVLHPYGRVRAVRAISETVLTCETREDDLSVWFDGSTIGLFGLDASTPPKVTLNNVNQAVPSDPQRYPYAPAAYGSKTMRWGPGSFHAGVVIHAFADTTARLISNEMDPDIYRAMITRRIGDNIGENVYE